MTLPKLPKGQRNYSISQDMLSQLPIGIRWQFLDLDRIFMKEPEPPKKLEIPDNEFVRIGIAANEPFDVVKKAKELNENGKWNGRLES